MSGVDEIMREAVGMFGSDPAGAAAKCAEAVKAAPDDERGYCGMALALRFAGRYRESAACMEELLKIRPGAAYAHGLIGDAAENEGRKEDALASYERMLEIDPDDMAARFKRSIMLGSTGRVKDDKYYWKVLHGRQKDALAEKTRRIILSAVLKTIGGQVSHDDVVVMTAGMRQALDVLGGHDAASGFLKRAYPRMDEDSAEYARGMLARASELAGEGRFKEAAAVAEAAIVEAPDWIEARSAKVTFLAELGRYEEAVECADEIIRVRPGGAYDLCAKGMLLEKAGRPGQAAACYERAAEIEPGYMAARYLKCSLLAASGDARGLAECYRQAMKAEPDGEESAGMKNRMRRERRELSRRAKSAGSLEAGFAEFMREAGVGAEPKWGRGYGSAPGPAPGGGRPRKRAPRTRAGRRR